MSFQRHSVTFRRSDHSETENVPHSVPTAEVPAALLNPAVTAGVMPATSDWLDQRALLTWADDGGRPV